MPSDRKSLQALKNIITEVDLILETTPLPQNRTGRSRELLRSALALTDDLLKQDDMNPAAALGSLGGSATARKLGSQHFSELAKKRKNRAGGRPKKL